MILAGMAGIVEVAGTPTAGAPAGSPEIAPADGNVLGGGITGMVGTPEK